MKTSYRSVNSANTRNIYLLYLQCIIPVFEHLLPEPYNSRILQLLFTFAHCHGLAKLRMHNDATLELLDNETTRLGQQLREFQSKTCSAFKTQELDCEKQARERRKSKQANSTITSRAKQTTQGYKVKSLNLQTYKFHAIGDYVSSIRQFGTTDSYNTATVSCS
jgi:hypothetical protein